MNFMAITECADEGQALSMLEASSWKLEEAVGLFFASAAGGGTSMPEAAAFGASGSGGNLLPTQGLDEEGVRAPLASKIDRLVDSSSSRPFRPYGLSGRVQAPSVDVFRSFEAEGGKAAGGKEGGKTAALSSLFAPPTALLFQASLCVCV